VSSPERISSSSFVVPGALLAAGLVLAGWILGSEIKAARLGDRYVTVKGLVERQVKSDLAIWPVTLQETGDDLQSVTTRAQTDEQAILGFFTAQGFSAAEVEAGVIQVVDTQVDLNGGNKPPHRFIVKQTLTLTTAKVEAATAASQQALNLLKAGIVLVTENAYGQSGGVRYIFNGLNAIKPDMITEATRNARTAADRFAADSGSKVGSIRQAEQGVFSITAANGDSPAGPESAFGGSDTSSLMKKVRVVTTVQYYLEQ
jgi:hypothetical protein